MRCGNVGNYQYRSQRYESCNICSEKEKLSNCRGMDELLGEELKVWADKLAAHERLQGKIEEILQR